VAGGDMQASKSRGAASIFVMKCYLIIIENKVDIR